MKPDAFFPGLVAAAGIALFGLILLKSVDEIGGDATIFIALLFFPVLGFLLASGQLTEISGPGGWGAKFRAAAEQPVDVELETEPISVVTKAEMPRLQRQIDRVSPRSSVVLQFEAGSTAYTPQAIDQYVHRLREIDPRLVIVFVDGQGRFRASTDALSVGRLASMDHLMHDFTQNLEREDFTALRQLFPLTSRSVRQEQSNGSALRAMLRDGVETLVVTDEFKKPVGVVRRDQIMARLMAELAGE